MNRNESMQAELTTSEDQNDEFFEDVKQGLSREQKMLPSKYFYDQRGSQLFDQICQLGEYYPTRTEIEIMRVHSGEMARQLQDPSTLIEFGSGSSVKTDYLLNELPSLQTYVPVDISAEHLAIAGQAIARRFPNLSVRPLASDFTQLDKLPLSMETAPQPHCVYFPGSTIGNFTPYQATNLLDNIANIIGETGQLLIGFDLIKKTSVLELAYNDSEDVTAEFNKNVLRRINCELDGNFDLDAFDHHAIWNAAEDRIEMHLRSLADQVVVISGTSFDFDQSETICTEYSHKYDLTSMERLAATAGLELCKSWTDSRNWFCVASFRAANTQ